MGASTTGFLSTHASAIVAIDHPLPLVDVRAGDRAEEHEAGIVDQDVDPAEPLDDGLHRLSGLHAIGDVGLDGQRGAVGGFDVAHERVEPVLAAGDDGDGRAVLGEAASGRVADSAAGSSDDRHGSGEFRIHD